MVSTLFFALQSTGASAITEDEVQRARLFPVIKHETKVGVIMCRDPQVEFNQEQWLSDGINGTGGHLREHMLVDVVVNKRLLNKTKADVDALFLVKYPDQWTPNGVIRYEVFAGSTAKCGQAPQLLVEAFYDKNYKLTKYRSRYLAEGVNSNPVDTKWVE